MPAGTQYPSPWNTLLYRPRSHGVSTINCRDIACRCLRQLPASLAQPAWHNSIPGVGAAPSTRYHRLIPPAAASASQPKARGASDNDLHDALRYGRACVMPDSADSADSAAFVKPIFPCPSFTVCFLLPSFILRFPPPFIHPNHAIATLGPRHAACCVILRRTRRPGCWRRVWQLVDTIRQRGHASARLDPLGRVQHGVWLSERERRNRPNPGDNDLTSVCARARACLLVCVFCEYVLVHVYVRACAYVRVKWFGDAYLPSSLHRGHP